MVGFEIGLVLLVVKPVVAEPIEVGELLVGKLVSLPSGAVVKDLPTKSFTSSVGEVTSLPSPAIQSVRLRAC